MNEKTVIFHIDDEETFLDLTKVFLQKMDPVLEYYSSNDPVEALKQLNLNSNSIDIIICDYQMPELNGIEVLVSLRNQGIEVPFIILTGKGREDVVIEAMNKGADYYLQKSSNAKILFKELYHFIIQAKKHKSAIQRIKLSEKRYRSLFNGTRNGVAVYEPVNNGEDFIFKDINKVGEEIDKIRREELIGKSLVTLFPSVKEFGLLEVLQGVLRTGNPAFHPIELYEDNRITGWRENYVYKLPSGEVVAVYNDITKRKQAEEALQKQREWLEVTLSSIGDAVITTDNNAKITFMNPVAEELTRWTAQEALGRDISDVFHIINEHTRQIVENPVDRVLQNGLIAGLSNHTILNTRDGKEIPIDDCGAPIKSKEGVSHGVVLVFRDISERKETEEILESSEGRYRELFDNMSNGVAVYEAVDDGKDFVFIDFNKAGEKIENIKREDLLNHKVTEVFPGVKDFGIFEVFQRVWRTGKPEKHPISSYKDDRITGWRENYIYKLPSGEIVAVYNDITESKKMDEELQESEQRLRELCENMSSGVAVYDAVEEGDDFVFKDLNPAGEKISGVKKDEIIGMSVQEAFPSVKDIGLFEVFQRVWKTGKAETHPVSQYKDQRIYHWTQNHIYKLPSGEIVAVYDDITEREMLKERIQQENEMYFKTIDSLIHPFYVINVQDYTFDLMNSAAKKLYSGDNRGTCYGFTHGRESPCSGIDHPCPLILVEKTKKFVSVEHQHYDVNGNILFLQVNAHPIFGKNGEVIKIIEYTIDITKRKQAENSLIEQKEETELYLDIITHDINNYNLSARGYLDLILEDSVPDSETSVFGKSAITSLSQVTTLLSNISIMMKERITSFHNLHPVNILETVNGVTGVIIGSFPQKKIKINAEGIELDVDILVDSLFKQLLLNLLTNAVKNDEHEIIDIEIATETVQQDKKCLLTVTDHGKGIPPEKRTGLFERFSEFKKKGTGSGLGLFIVKTLADRYKGKIWIESRDPTDFTRGTVVKLELSTG